MATLKKTSSIRTDGAAELALQRLSELARQRAEATHQAEAKIAGIREQLRAAKEGIDREVKSLRGKLESFARRMLPSWESGEDGNGSRRTNRYTHGVIGYRKDPPGISTRGVDEAALLEQLKELGLKHCIREYEAPDFHALQREDDATLGLLGLKRTGGDRFQLDLTVPHTAGDR